MTKRIAHPAEPRQRDGGLRLLETMTFPGGVVLLRYERTERAPRSADRSRSPSPGPDEVALVELAAVERELHPPEKALGADRTSFGSHGTSRPLEIPALALEPRPRFPDGTCGERLVHPGAASEREHSLAAYDPHSLARLELAPLGEPRSGLHGATSRFAMRRQAPHDSTVEQRPEPAPHGRLAR